MWIIDAFILSHTWLVYNLQTLTTLGHSATRKYRIFIVIDIVKFGSLAKKKKHNMPSDVLTQNFNMFQTPHFYIVMLADKVITKL